MEEYTLWVRLKSIRKGPANITLGQLIPIVQHLLPEGYKAGLGEGADHESALVVYGPRDPPYCYGGQVGRIFGNANTSFDKKTAEWMVTQLIHEVNITDDNHKRFRFLYPNATRWDELNQLANAPISKDIAGLQNTGSDAPAKSDMLVTLMRILITCGIMIGIATIFDQLVLHV